MPGGGDNRSDKVKLTELGRKLTSRASAGLANVASPATNETP